MAIIYSYTNLINQKKYIGQTINPQTRKSAHKSVAYNENSGSYNTPFSRAIRKYGFEQFKYEVLCVINDNDVEILNLLEQYYIKKYNTQLPNGYNVLEGGSNASRPPKTEKEKIKLTWVQAKLTEEEVIFLRQAYAKGKSPKLIYDELYADKLNYQAFLNIWSGRRYKNICPELISKGRHTKLNWEIVEMIRNDYKTQKISYDALAKKYNISKATIADVIKERTWKNK